MVSGFGILKKCVRRRSSGLGPAGAEGDRIFRNWKNLPEIKSSDVPPPAIYSGQIDLKIEIETIGLGF